MPTPPATIEIAKFLTQKAQALNVFGSANILGMDFQEALGNKYRYNPKALFNLEELTYLKATIAGLYIIQQIATLKPLDLSIITRQDRAALERHNLKTMLNLARILILHGSSNCNIAAVVVVLACIHKINVPLQLAQFHDLPKNLNNEHTFIALGCPKKEDHNRQLSLAVLDSLLGEQNTSENYIICDAYQREAYPMKKALASSGEKLAKFHTITTDDEDMITGYLDMR